MKNALFLALLLVACGTPNRSFIELDPDAPKPTSKELDAAACTPLARGLETKILIYNDLDHAIDLHWVTPQPQCVEIKRGTVAAKTRFDQPAYIGDVWHLKETDGRLLKAFDAAAEVTEVHVP